MSLFALSPEWSDFYAIGGFVVGVVGLVIGVGGFWIAIWQIRKTKHAVEAAQEAASRMMEENKKAYQRFVGSYASLLLSELQNAVNGNDWKLASMRSLDLGGLLASLPSTGSLTEDDAIGSSVADLRDFGQKFSELTTKQKPKYPVNKWKRLVQALHARLDILRAPFGGIRDGQRNPNDSDANAPTDRSDAPGEVESRGSDLGPPRNI